jgi:hypothetical protein
MLLVRVFCGIDWAEDHYDVALVDQAGVVLAERRMDDDALGYQRLLALLAEYGDDQVEPIPVAIETPRGLVVACLRRTGRQVYAINPLSVARYRERHSVLGLSPTGSTPNCWPTFCAPTGLRTGRCQLTRNWLSRLLCLRALNKMPSGTGNRSPTNSAPCCASTTRRSWRHSKTVGRVAWRIRMPALF